ELREAHAPRRRTGGPVHRRHLGALRRGDVEEAREDRSLMSLLPIALGALLGISGIAVLVRATARPLVDLDAVLGELDRTDVPVDELTEPMALPLLAR